MNTIKEEWIKEGQTFDHEVEYWDKHILYHERGFRTEYIRQFPSIYMEKYNPNGTVYYEKDTIHGTERAYKDGENGERLMLVLVPYWGNYGLSHFTDNDDEADRIDPLSGDEARRMLAEWVEEAENEPHEQGH